MKRPGVFGNLVRRRRQMMEMTLDDLAKKCGTTKSYVSGVESGYTRPFGPKKVPKVAAALGIDVRVLLILSWAEKAPKIVRDEVVGMCFDWISGHYGKKNLV